MLTTSLSDLGGIQWELLALLAISWVLVYFALWKGITKARYVSCTKRYLREIGSVQFIYVCSVLPYMVLPVILVRGLTLPGAMQGITYLLVPDTGKLKEATVWKDAGTQVFYTSGVGYGILTALGSHNKFGHNCYR